MAGFRFLLGGADLEMAEIRSLLDRHAADRVEDRRLAWGATLSAYRTELLAALAAGETPVAIELPDDLPPGLFDRDRMRVVDHHGERAGADKPTSIEQVFALLGLPAAEWTRWLALVAANDRDHVAGMLAAGASAGEIAAVRAADRRAQGVTEADEAEAVRAIAARRQDGGLTVVETVSHTSSAIADRMMPALGGPGYRRLLVAMPEKVAVFADGEAIRALGESYPDSWWGGDLPAAGYWGMTLPAVRRGELGALVSRLR
nr:hypothetical protein [uncultured Rhodopila sp.]